MRAHVGSSVLYWRSPTAEPYAAVVTRAHTTVIVSLTVFPPDDAPFQISHVPRAEDAPPEGPRWQWPALTEEGGP